MPLELPSWCRVVAADGPSLLIAPHGGLCARDLLAPDTAGTLRGNDLYTGEVAQQLADRLGASLIANLSVDRNELDLNRISEIAATAPWFLDLIQEHAERILARHPVAQILVVHGWHVVQPRCDVGVGARLASAEDAHHATNRLTVSPDYVAGTLETLRTSAEAHGIRTTYGERWPAAHRNNVMQLFRLTRAAAAGAAVHPLGRLAAAGRVQAVQLELGAPLRWPGVWRDRFLGAAAVAFGGHAVVSAARPRRTVRDATRERAIPVAGDAVAPRGTALQSFDERAGAHGLGIVVGMGPLSRDEVGARLLLLPGGQRMLLFTGHERVAGAGDASRVAGLEVQACGGALEVRFRGPVLDVPDAGDYFRREAAQLDARLVDLDLELHFVPFGGGAFGRVEGEARLRDRTWRIAAGGFTDPVLARPSPPVLGQALRLTASFGTELGLSASVDSAGRASVTRCTPHARQLLATAAAVRVPEIAVGGLAPPFAIALRDEPPLRCTPLSHVSILRPAGNGLFARITFGAAAYAFDDGRRGSGFYEHSTALLGGDEQGEEP